MLGIQVKRYGGPEVLEFGELPDPAPAAGEVVVRVKVAGVNFTDVYSRIGTYPGALPFIPGVEGVGIVEQLGSGVTDVKVGARVGWVMIKGGYAERVALPAQRLVPIPDGVDDRTAAALLLQGMTAHFLLTDCYRVQRGEWILIHAAAGGVGLLMTQIAHRIVGARVIGTTSTEEKAALARAAGADEVVLYTKEDFQTAVRRITDGVGVSAVYDSVGKTTFLKSLDSLRPRGYMVLFGGSSGPAPTIDPMILNPKGSLFLTRPTLGNYVSSREELLRRAGDVFGWAASGELEVRAEHDYALADAAQAHADLEGRRTTGKILLAI